MTLTYGSTFSGIGGLDIAIEHVFGAEPLWHVEPDPYAAAVLREAIGQLWGRLVG